MPDAVPSEDVGVVSQLEASRGEILEPMGPCAQIAFTQHAKISRGASLKYKESGRDFKVTSTNLVIV